MRMKRRRRRSYTRVYILLAILVALVAGVMAGSGSSEDSTAANVDSGIVENSNFLHIMLMGVDRRNDDVGRSDTLMMVTVDKDQERGSVLSIPRDTRVKIEKNGYDKINHAYAYGGSKLTRQTVENLTGVTMDYYVLVDIKAFERIIDALDGIDLNVEKRMYYEDPWDDNGGLVIDLYPGMQHLDGEKAIQYVRYRDGEGDIGRINRQQHFIKAVMDKMLSPSVVSKLPKLVEEIRSAVETDMPLSEMISLASSLSGIRQNGLASEMLPGTPAYLEDISYWLPDIMSLRQQVVEEMQGQLAGESLAKAEATKAEYEASLPAGLTVVQESSSQETAKNKKSDQEETKSQNKENSRDKDSAKKSTKASSSHEIAVLVINDSGINGAGAKMADILRSKGFRVTGVDTGNKSDRSHTIIVTDSGNTDRFYGMPFSCTIMDGGDSGEAVVYIGQDYN